MGAFYWERHPDGPFATLISVAASWLHPEIDDLDGLKRFAKHEDHDHARAFKSELRQALRDPARLPGHELSRSVQYDNFSDEGFLRWLWFELYGDEPFDASVLTRLRALPEPFAGRLPWPAGYEVFKAGRAGDWDKALELLLAGLAEGSAPVSPAERGELTAMLTAIGQPAAVISALMPRPVLPRAAAGSAHSLLQHRLPPA